MATLILTAIPLETAKVKLLHPFEEFLVRGVPAFASSARFPGALFLAEGGLGAANVSTTLAIVASRAPIVRVIFIGLAGAIDPSLKVGDVVIAERIFQHDSYRSSSSGNKHYLKPGISAFNRDAHTNPTHPTNSEMTANAENAIRLLGTQRVYRGTLASGSEFMCDSARKKALFDFDPGILAIDMEAAAVAQTSEVLSLSLSVVKVISDTVDPSDNTIFKEFADKLEHSTAALSTVAKAILNRIEEELS